MTRIRGGFTRRRRHKKILGMTKGHQGVRHRLFRRANESMLHAQQYAFDHRRQKKGEMRRLWNIRINAAARANGISYSKLIHGLNLAGIEINRKMLSELAVTDGQAFAEIVQHAQAALEQQAA